jgi:hypothetical protein
VQHGIHGREGIPEMDRTHCFETPNIYCSEECKRCKYIRATRRWYILRKGSTMDTLMCLGETGACPFCVHKLNANGTSEEMVSRAVALGALNNSRECLGCSCWQECPGYPRQTLRGCSELRLAWAEKREAEKGGGLDAG